MKLFFESDGYNFSFETVFTGVGGKFQILKEVLDIKGVLTVEREGEWVRVKHDEKFFEEAWEKIQQTEEAKQAPFVQFLERGKEDLIEQSVRVSKEDSSCNVFGYSKIATYSENLALTRVNYQRQPAQQYQVLILVPTTREEERVRAEGEERIEFGTTPLPWYVERKIHEFIGKIVVLKGLNIREMKEPYKQRREAFISEDGGNVCNILYNLFLKENKIPDRLIH